MLALATLLWWHKRSDKWLLDNKISDEQYTSVGIVLEVLFGVCVIIALFSWFWMAVSYSNYAAFSAVGNVADTAYWDAMATWATVTMIVAAII